jgi:L-amino acid N-acyltransferase YncA
MLIRDADPGDWAAIWSFFRQIAAAGETYAFDREIGEDEARRAWMIGPPGQAFVAVDAAGTILGTAIGYPVRPGPGSHVASASFMVDPRHGGRGIGRALGERVPAWARERGFRAMQFNAVVESNEPAVALWRSLGFTVLATVPEAFATPDGGYVGLLIMHRRL